MRLPQTVGNRRILLHINRKIKKIFIFAANLKQKKKRKKLLGTKYTIDIVDKTLNTYK